MGNDNKIKLTRKQAKAIDAHTAYDLGKWFYTNTDKEHYLYKLFKDNNIEEIMKAKLVGYEIEEKFKVGDWVVYKNGEGHGYKTHKIISIVHFYAHFSETECMPLHSIRHATPEEIAEEKERRWWARSDREVWQLKAGDCLIDKHDRHSCNVKFVEAVDKNSLLLVDGVEDEFYEDSHHLEVVKSNYKVLCFVEDRKDS